MCKGPEVGRCVGRRSRYWIEQGKPLVVPSRGMTWSLWLCVETASLVKPGEETGAIQNSDGGHSGQAGWTGLASGSTREFQDKPRFGS